MKKLFYLLLIVSGWHTSLYAQDVRAIQGVVKDAVSGVLVGNATITALVSRKTTFSNQKGVFNIIVNANDTLLISHIEYAEQKMPVLNVSAFTVLLHLKNVLLDNVTINTGYQQLKPNEVNGSYVFIDNKTLNLQTGGNILQRLNGVTGSLLLNAGKRNKNPQNTTNISIRGLSTINGPLDPLIVVDNFIYDGNIDNINPNDVESVTILKDAAASSIWGARAGNGVIVITLKKGKFNQPLQVDFNSNWIVTDKPDLYYQPSISNGDFIDFEQVLYNNNYYKKSFTSSSHPAVSPAVQLFQDKKTGLISESEFAHQINILKQIDNRDQFTKYYYQKALSQQYALNLHGGGNNIAWLVSGNYTKAVDNLRAKNDQFNLRFENTYTPLKGLQINAGVYFTGAQSASGLPTYQSAIGINGKSQIPYLPLTDDEGTAVAVPTFYNARYLDTLGGGKLMDWNYYPLDDYKHYVTKTNREELLANLGLNYVIAKCITVNFLYQYQKQKTEANIVADTSSYYTRNLINTYSQVDRASGIVNYIVPRGGILNKSFSNQYAYNFRGQVNATRSFNHHQISAIAGLEIRNSATDGSSSVYYGYTPDPLVYAANMDYFNRYPSIINGGASTLPAAGSLSATDNRFISQFANASYTYFNRYTLSGSLRRDGSNIFGAATNDRWKPLWSAGLGWELYKEKFYHLPWLLYSRFSISYGVSGNVDLSKSAVPVARASIDPLTNLPVEQILTLSNSKLSWERAYQTNFRFDFSSINNVLKGSIEYYHKKGSRLYGPAPYDYTTWGLTKSITANVADMKGNGIDVSIQSNNVSRKFAWSTSYLFNYNTSKTTAYYTPDAASVSRLVGSSGAIITPVIGKPLYAIAAYKWGGLDDHGNPMGYLKDTLSTDYRAISQSKSDEDIASGTFTFIGPANPVIFGSLLNDFSYNGFSLSFNIIYKAGYYLFRPALLYTTLASAGTTGAEYKNRWLQPGDENKTQVPSFAYPLNVNRDAFYNSSEANVVKGDHIRLQFINLGYSFLKSRKTLPFKSLQIYINVSNLGILWRGNNDHIDPDFASGIPDPRSYTMGVRANF